MADNPDLMTPAEVAEYFRLPLMTIYQWRTRNVGPAGFKVGKHVRYRRSVVEAWMNAQAAAS